MPIEVRGSEILGQSCAGNENPAVHDLQIRLTVGPDGVDWGCLRCGDAILIPNGQRPPGRMQLQSDREPPPPGSSPSSRMVVPGKQYSE
jgi:hypothetical protein